MAASRVSGRNPERPWQNLAVVAVAAVLGVGWFLAQVGVAIVGPGLPADWTEPEIRILATMGALMAQALPQWMRLRMASGAFVYSFGFYLLAVELTGDRAFVAGPILLFAVFSYAATSPTLRTVVVLALAATAEFGVQLHASRTLLPELLEEPLRLVALGGQVLAFYAVAGAAGMWLRSQKRRLALIAARASDTQRERDAVAATAIVLERNRMARELHDIAAHHVTAVIMQTKLAERHAATNPEATQRHLNSAITEAQSTLDNLRQVFGLLRTPDDAGVSLHPQPTIERLPELVRVMRESEHDVTVTTHGRLDNLTLSVSLAAYRIVQESLSNARKHAPGSLLRVDIRRERRTLAIDVTSEIPRNRTTVTGRTTDDVVYPPSGYGILGMRERAQVLGGELHSESTPTGWRTRAVLPTERPVERSVLA